LSIANHSLWVMCLLLFAEGGTLSFLTTPTLLYFGKFHASWVVALLRQPGPTDATNIS